MAKICNFYLAAGGRSGSRMGAIEKESDTATAHGPTGDIPVVCCS